MVSGVRWIIFYIVLMNGDMGGVWVIKYGDLWVMLGEMWIMECVVGIGIATCPFPKSRNPYFLIIHPHLSKLSDNLLKPAFFDYSGSHKINYIIHTYVDSF